MLLNKILNDVRSSIFFYTEEELVLKDLSFEIKPREKIVLVGARSAGKSTIFQFHVKTLSHRPMKYLHRQIAYRNV